MAWERATRTTATIQPTTIQPPTGSTPGREGGWRHPRSTRIPTPRGHPPGHPPTTGRDRPPPGIRAPASPPGAPREFRVHWPSLPCPFQPRPAPGTTPSTPPPRPPSLTSCPTRVGTATGSTSAASARATAIPTWTARGDLYATSARGGRPSLAARATVARGPTTAPTLPRLPTLRIPPW